MPRIGLTYQDVEMAAEKLREIGQQPTQRSVRDILGRGSTTTIARHLLRWSAGRAVVHGQAPAEIPVAVSNAISSALDVAARQARQQLEAQLIQLQAQSIEVADSNEDLEKSLEAAETERDSALGRVAAQEQTIDRLTAEAANAAERITIVAREAADARQDAAVARMEMQGIQGRYNDLAAQMEMLRADLASARDDLANARGQLAASRSVPSAS